MHQHATLEDTVYFWFAANDTSGSGGDGASPLYDVRLAGAASDAAPVLSGSATLLSHADYPAGCHEVAVAATAVNGFAAASTYGVFCTLAVDSQNPTGFVGSFTLGPIPANVTKWGGTAIGSAISAANLAKLEDMLDGTGGQTLTLEQLRIDSSAAGGAIDIDNSSGPGISINVAEADGIAITTSTSGDGISITAADDVAPELVTAINATVDTALEDIGLDHLISVAAAEDEVADNSVIARLAATEGDWSEFNDENHSLEALRVRGDAAWATATSVTVSDKTGFKLASDGLDLVTAWTVDITGTVSGNSTHAAADVKTAIEAEGSSLAQILEDTGTTLPATLTTITNYVDCLPATLNNFDPSSDKVYLADGAHGGSSATLTLSTLTVSNSSGDAVTFESTGGGGDGIVCTGEGAGYGANIANGLYVHRTTGTAISVSGSQGALSMSTTGTGHCVSIDPNDGDGIRISNVATPWSAIFLDSDEYGIRISATGTDFSGDITGSLSGSVGSLTGHTAQTGDTYALANGAAGFSAINTDVEAILADTGTDGVVVASGSKTGFKLASDGLDSITATAPGGVASTFPQMLVQLWRRFFKKSTLTSTELKTYADDDTTAETTQTVSDDGTTQTQGSAS